MYKALTVRHNAPEKMHRKPYTTGKRYSGLTNLFSLAPKNKPFLCHLGLLSESRAVTISREQLEKSTDQTVCYERAVVAGFLKGRWTINTTELPDHKETITEEVSLTSRQADVGGFVSSVDEVALRVQTFASLEEPQPRPARVLIYLARERRREFEPDSESAFLGLLEEVALKYNYKLHRVLFDGMTFTEQVAAVKVATVAIGLHGANLVNAFFMPVGAALIELFPFAFDHDMYGEQSGSGLRYFRYNIDTGEDFGEVGMYTSRMDCMRKSHDCKMHYRSDYRKVRISSPFCAPSSIPV